MGMGCGIKLFSSKANFRPEQRAKQRPTGVLSSELALNGSSALPESERIHCTHLNGSWPPVEAKTPTSIALLEAANMRPHSGFCIKWK